MRSAVDFPQPDGPTSTMNSPSAMSRSSASHRLGAVRIDLPDLVEDDLSHVALHERVRPTNHSPLQLRGTGSEYLLADVWSLSVLSTPRRSGAEFTPDGYARSAARCRRPGAASVTRRVAPVGGWTGQGDGSDAGALRRSSSPRRPRGRIAGGGRRQPRQPQDLQDHGRRRRHDRAGGPEPAGRRHRFVRPEPDEHRRQPAAARLGERPGRHRPRAGRDAVHLRGGRSRCFSVRLGVSPFATSRCHPARPCRCG